MTRQREVSGEATPFRPIRRVLVANRGEIAVRITRAAHRLGIQAVAIYPTDDAHSRHVVQADACTELPGAGAAAYLDVHAVVEAAIRMQCDAIHPGYGFLSESAALAQACIDADLVFVGVGPDALTTLGDKVLAREAATGLGIPVLPASPPGVSQEEAASFRASLGPGAAVVVKAVAGGGGRGIQPVLAEGDLGDALRRCRSEARNSFGDDRVYVEALMSGARHIEVQLLGDGYNVVSLGDRDCSVQRRRQKLIEIAPAPHLSATLRDRLHAASVELGRTVSLRGVATIEFLVDVPSSRFMFLEANPRIQVEHTVTEEVTGVDLVAAQLRLAGGATLADLGPLGPPSGDAIQLRLNAEVIQPDGSVHAQFGTVTSIEFPTGRDVRVDTAAGGGTVVSPRYDSLLAKVVVSEPDGGFEAVVRAAQEAAGHVRVAGLDTNINLLRALLERPELVDGALTTQFVDTHLPELLSSAQKFAHQSPTDHIRERVDTDPSLHRSLDLPPDGELLVSPMNGVVVSIDVSHGDRVAPGTPAIVLESMKMEHVVSIDAASAVEDVLVAVGDVVKNGQPVLVLRHTEEHAGDASSRAVEEIDLDHVRPELSELRHRVAKTQDAQRADAVAKRRRTGQRTARENIADLVDDGSFVEYGALTVAAQRGRRPLEELIDRTPADGLVCGVARVEGERCVVMAYDYTVMAGTQGQYNHRKQDRQLDIARREGLPVVIFAEGGGGRPGDSDSGWITGLDVQAFARYAALSGDVPLVAIVSGRCFAGNAALAGLSDVIIATRDASLGMSGPAMIEGGGLGTVSPEDVGPMSMQVSNGVVDVLVADEEAATQAARHYLSFFTQDRRPGPAPDTRLLRRVVPENRARAYDVRHVVQHLADIDSALELRAEFATGIRTWLARIEGRAVGIVANNPLHLGGAIDAAAADKMARFLQLCNAHGLPLVSLCDTPGFMIGPDSESQAAVRRLARVFLAGAKLRVPTCMVVLRKAYGLGAMAMAGGSVHAPLATWSWPTGELGPMGLEGAVRLGYKEELAGADSPESRQQRYDELVAEAYKHGKAINVASVYEIDGVIDPADTRQAIEGVFSAANPVRRPRSGFIDSW